MSGIEQDSSAINEAAILYETLTRMAELQPKVDEYNTLKAKYEELKLKGVSIPEDGSYPEGYNPPQPDWEISRF